MSDLFTSRIIGHIDMDCFYVQVERTYDSSLIGKPVAVVQYNPFGDLKNLVQTDKRIVSNGSLIAVSYEARALGVKRIMRGAEAKKACPEVILVQVPVAHGKADLTIYRDAGDRIVKLIAKLLPGVIIEKASIDEVYLDLTTFVDKRMERLSTRRITSNIHEDNAADDAVDEHQDNMEDSSPIATKTNNQCIETFRDIECLASESLVAGDDESALHLSRTDLRRGHSTISIADPNIVPTSNENQNNGDGYIIHSDNEYPLDYQRILCGAAITAEIRDAIRNQLGFSCSGGIAHCKILAKIASGMHKPNKQTIVPSHKVIQLMSNIPISRVPGFGAKLGEQVCGPPFNLKVLSDIKTVDKDAFIDSFGHECYDRIVDLSKGIDTEEVKDRSIGQSLASGKSFRSSNAIVVEPGTPEDTLLHWLEELSGDLHNRIQNDISKNHRRPKLLTINVSLAQVLSAIVTPVPISSESMSLAPQPFKLENEWKSGGSHSVSRSVPFGSNTSAAFIRSSALTIVRKIIKDFRESASKPNTNTNTNATANATASTTVTCITYLALTGTNFEEIASESQSISSFFNKVDTASESQQISIPLKLTDVFSKSPVSTSVSAHAPSAGIRRFMAKPSLSSSSSLQVTSTSPSNQTSPAQIRSSIAVTGNDNSNKNNVNEDEEEDDDEVVFIPTVNSKPTSTSTKISTKSALERSAIDPSVYEALPANIRAEIDSQLAANNRSGYNPVDKKASKTKPGSDGPASKVARISKFFNSTTKSK